MVVRAESLGKRFGRIDALQGLSFNVPEGSTFALVGANGAGKTTTIKVLMNILGANGRHGDGARHRYARAIAQGIRADRLRLRTPRHAHSHDGVRVHRLSAAVLSDVGSCARDRYPPSVPPATRPQGRRTCPTACG
jgi:ATPase subunit of ABC transporter with duplicated ATPase domains